jgi:heme-degrading monooxygenase HmoA
MIARVWSARTTREWGPLYAEHLRTHVLPSLKAMEGYRGARLWERQLGEGVEIVVVTSWDSLDAIRGFAGDEIERAVVADEAAALLLEFDEWVRHYELRLTDEPS